MYITNFIVKSDIDLRVRDSDNLKQMFWIVPILFQYSGFCKNLFDQLKNKEIFLIFSETIIGNLEYKFDYFNLNNII